MLYFLDTANVEDIRHCNEFYPLSGVTTNPSIIAREKKDFWVLIREIREIIGPNKLLFAQTVQSKAEKMVEDYNNGVSPLNSFSFAAVDTGQSFKM